MRINKDYYRFFKYPAFIVPGFLGLAFADQPEFDMELFLELTVNGRPTHHIALVDYRKPYFYLNEEDLSETPILIKEFGDIVPGKLIAINANDNVEVHYNEELQTLDINVPPSWLPRQQVGRNREAIKAERSNGFIFNYDAYFSKSEGSNTQLNFWNEIRGFGDYGIISNTGVYRSEIDGGSSDVDQYRRYDTYWEYSNEEKLYTARAGDIITRPLSWSSAARLGGIQLSHNFSLRPDLITYPLPEFSGEVGLPSTVDLLVNGHKYYSHDIDPGPYDVNQVTHLSGAGEAVLVTTDALGRTVSVDVPFYVTSQLLKKGLLDYTVSLGSLRKNYGQKNFSYSQYALDGSFRYGLSDEWTIEGHSELATSLQVIGAGIVTNVGRIGLINASLMGTRYKGNTGSQIYLGYEYVNSDFGVRASYQKRSRDYRDIASMDSDGDLYSESMQLSFNTNFEEFGGISLGYFANKMRDQSQQNTISLGWSKSLRDYGSVSAYVNRNNDRDNRWSASVQWTIPLGDLGALSASVNRSDNAQNNYSMSYSKSIPSNGGFGWRANYNKYHQQEDYFNGALSWRNEKLDFEGGMYGTRKSKSYWADFSGAIVMMDGQFIPSNQVNDAFVLVSTDGASDIDVKFENAVVGKTNKDGYLLVTKVPSYYNAKYEIDALGLPFNLQAETVEKRVSVKSGGGYMLEFPIKTTTPMTLTLLDKQGAFIEIGSYVITSYGEESYVGWDGTVFFEYLEEENELQVLLPQGGECRVNINLEDHDGEVLEQGITHLGNFVCQ